MSASFGPVDFSRCQEVLELAATPQNPANLETKEKGCAASLKLPGAAVAIYGFPKTLLIQGR